MLEGKSIGGRYRVRRRIDAGGMAAIYEVDHERLPRSFAMKVLTPDLAADADALARLRREADIIARLRHPNIVEIVDWETLEDGAPCIVMELLRGQDLAARLHDAGPLPWQVIERVMRELLSALRVAHAAGVIHRDLKPRNVFLARDDTGAERAKLLDFGVSKVRGTDSVRERDLQALGTPLYMSPEQAEGASEDVGPETDVWALGAVLYEMAAGRPAFEAATTPAIVYRICHGRPDPLARKDLPQAFVEVIERALSRDPDRRLGSIEELEKVLTGAAPPRRHVWRVAFGIGLVAAVTMGVIALRQKSPSPVAAPPMTAPVVTIPPAPPAAMVVPREEPPPPKPTSPPRAKRRIARPALAPAPSPPEAAPPETVRKGPPPPLDP